MSLPHTLMVAQVQAILEQALHLPPNHGLLIRVGVLRGYLPAPATRARQQLYRVRKEMSPAYDTLQMVLSQVEPDHEILIVKRSEPLPAEPTFSPATPANRILSAEDFDL